MSDKTFIGLRTSALDYGDSLAPITRVNLAVDSDHIYTSGNDTGRTLEVDCPWGSQAMADSILAKVGSVDYHPYTASEAIVDPAAELGDGVTVGGVYSQIAIMDTDYDKMCLAEISAPESDEIDDEYPFETSAQRATDRKIAYTRSLISKTSEQIMLEVENELEGLSSAIKVDLTEISGRVTSAEGSISVALNTLDGLTVTDDEGTVRIKGGMVTADGLHVNAANIDGTLTASQINLTGAITWSDLASDAQNQVEGAYSAAQSAQTTASNASIAASNASNTASNAYTMASNANSLVSGWQYGGTAYLDGAMLMIGTVQASSLQGGSISLLNQSGGTSGTITLTSAVTGSYAVDISSNAAIRLMANNGSAYIGTGTAFLEVRGSEAAVFCRGTLAPTPSGSYYCGNANYKWSAVYATTGTIQTSDRNAKHDIQDLPDKYLEMLLLVPPKIFRLNDGTSNRVHVGYIAQDVEEVMAKLGIDSLEFAGFVKDKDEDGNDIYMLRYEEFIAIHTLAVQKIFQRLEAAGI